MLFWGLLVQLCCGEPKHKLKWEKNSQNQNTFNQKTISSNEDLKLIESVFSNIRVETSGSIIQNSKLISIEVHRSIFTSCTALNQGGAIYSTKGTFFIILSSCFNECYNNKSFGAVCYIKLTNQTIEDSLIYSCGKPTAADVTFFEGSYSDIYNCNYTRSDVSYSISSYIGAANSPSAKYVNIAFCKPSQGVVLHANNCNKALYENVNIFNNTDQKNRWGILHFDGTSAVLTSVNILGNVGFSFRSSGTSTSVVTSYCYSDDSGACFGFTVDKNKRIEENHLKTILCLITAGSFYNFQNILNICVAIIVTDY